MTSTDTAPWAPDTAQVRGAALTGAAGHVVNVRARITNGPDSFTITGLPGEVTWTLRDRIRAAVLNSGLTWPSRQVTVDVRPPGQHTAGLDLPMAIAVLTAAGAIPPDAVVPCVLIGDLGLDGAVRPVRGVLPAVTAAATDGAQVAVVAPADAAEAALMPGMAVVPCPSLRAVVTWLGARPRPGRSVHADCGEAQDLVVSRLAASPVARLALQASAAGGHHLCLTGPRRSDLAGLAEGIRLLMPPLDAARSAEVSAVYSAAGLLDGAAGLITEPPWRAPHHGISHAAMIGGGPGAIRPGEVPLAHGGVLFLDQAPEFARGVLSALRQPLADGEVAVSRHGVITRFPARFILIAAIASCPCGGQPGCQCTPLETRRYAARAESELGSRLAVRLTVSPPNQGHAAPGELEVWAARVTDARDRAGHRLRGTPWRVNAEVPGSELAGSWRPGAAAFAEVSRAVDLGQISSRSAIEVVRLAWTLADLAGQSRPTAAECAQALAFHLGAAS